MRMIIFLALVVTLLAGCATFKETIKGIAADPSGYALEATNTADTVKGTVPELPYGICIGIGYAISFFRRWYVNIKKAQAKATLTTP